MRYPVRLILAALVMLCSFEVGHAIPQLINYQGVLTDGSGTPITTTVSVEFRIWDDSTSGAESWSEPHSITPDAEGHFQVLLGSLFSIPISAFGDDGAYLGIKVGSDPEMTPRIPLVSTGYSYRTATVNGAYGGFINGKLTVGLTNVNSGSYSFVAGDSNWSTGDANAIGGGKRDTVRGSYCVIAGGDRNYIESGISDGSIGGGVNNRLVGTQSTIAGGVSNLASGAASTVGGGSGNHAMGSHSAVGGGTGDTASGAYSTVGGGNGNVASGNSATVAGGYLNMASVDGSSVGGGTGNHALGFGAVIAGGGVSPGIDSNVASGYNAAILGGTNNVAAGAFSTVGGGQFNTAAGDSATVGGGSSNEADTMCATVGGGEDNHALHAHATVGGGWKNVASGVRSSVAGGLANTASGVVAHVGGGSGNTAGGWYSVVPGGWRSYALGNTSVALGPLCRANHDGTVVIAADDNISVPSMTIESGGPQQMVLRADGGIFLTDTNGTATYDPTKLINTRGGAYLSGSGTTWTNASDRNAKENFAYVNLEDLLEKIAELPIERWNYKDDDPGVQHIGPVAQDFYRLFRVGSDDKSISTIDPSGIALAAIKELNEKLHRKDDEIDALKQQMDEMRAMIESLTQK